MNRQQTLYRSLVAVAAALSFGGCVSITYTGVPPSSDASAVRTGAVASSDCDCRCPRTNVYGWYPAGEYPDPRYTGGYPVRYPYYGPYGWIPDYRYGHAPSRREAGQPTAPPVDNRGDSPTSHGYASGPHDATPPTRTGEPINGRSVSGTVEPRRDVPPTTDPNRGPSVGGGTHGEVVILVPAGDTNSARTGNPRTPADGGMQGGRVAVDGRPRRTDEGNGPTVRADNPTPTVRPTTPTPTSTGGSTGVGSTVRTNTPTATVRPTTPTPTSTGGSTGVGSTARTENPNSAVRPVQSGAVRPSGRPANETSTPQPATHIATPRAAEPRVSEPTPRPTTATPSGSGAVVITTRNEGAASQVRREPPAPVNTVASTPKSGTQSAAPAVATVTPRRGTAEVEHTAPTSGSGARNATDAPPTSAARNGGVQGGDTASGSNGTASAPR